MSSEVEDDFQTNKDVSERQKSENPQVNQDVVDDSFGVELNKETEEAIKQDDAKKLVELRASLFSKTEPQEASRTNLQKSVAEDQIRESEENLKKFQNNLRITLDDISANSKVMLNALYERQEQRLSPIQSSDEFQYLASLLNKISNFDEKIDAVSLDGINQNLQRLVRLVADMNHKNTGGAFKENPDNLGKLSYGIKSFSVSLDEAGRRLGPELSDEKMEEKRKDIRISLGTLSDQVGRLQSLVARMRSNVN